MNIWILLFVILSGTLTFGFPDRPAKVKNGKQKASTGLRRWFEMFNMGGQEEPLEPPPTRENYEFNNFVSPCRMPFTTTTPLPLCPYPPPPPRPLPPRPSPLIQPYPPPRPPGGVIVGPGGGPGLPGGPGISVGGAPLVGGGPGPGVAHAMGGQGIGVGGPGGPDYPSGGILVGPGPGFSGPPGAPGIGVGGVANAQAGGGPVSSASALGGPGIGIGGPGGPGYPSGGILVGPGPGFPGPPGAPGIGVGGAANAQAGGGPGSLASATGGPGVGIGGPGGPGFPQGPPHFIGGPGQYPGPPGAPGIGVGGAGNAFAGGRPVSVAAATGGPGIGIGGPGGPGYPSGGILVGPGPGFPGPPGAPGIGVGGVANAQAGGGPGGVASAVGGPGIGIGGPGGPGYPSGGILVGPGPGPGFPGPPGAPGIGVGGVANAQAGGGPGGVASAVGGPGIGIGGPGGPGYPPGGLLVGPGPGPFPGPGVPGIPIGGSGPGGVAPAIGGPVVFPAPQRPPIGPIVGPGLIPSPSFPVPAAMPYPPGTPFCAGQFPYVPPGFNFVNPYLVPQGPQCPISPRPDTPPCSTLEMLERLQLRTIHELIFKANLENLFLQTSNYTFLAPSDPAFAKLPEWFVASLHTDIILLRMFILEHFIKVDLLLHSVGNEFLILNARPGGHRLRFNVYLREYAYRMFTVDGARIVLGDIVTSEGHLNILNEALVPNPVRNAAQYLQEVPEFKRFMSAVLASETLPMFQGPDPFTFLIPYNRAFESFDLGTIQSNATALRNFVRYHLIPGTLYSNGLIDGQYATTLFDKEVKFSISSDGFSKTLTFVNNDIRVLKPDVPLLNGVAHIIDSPVSSMQEFYFFPHLSEFHNLEFGAMKRNGVVDENKLQDEDESHNKTVKH